MATIPPATNSFTIQAELKLPSEIFEYHGTFFRLSRTIDGKRKELTETELIDIKERLTAVIDEALVEGSLTIENIKAFDLNTCNRVFYVYNHDEFGPWDGAHSDSWVRLKEATINTFLGISAPKSTDGSTSSSSPTTSSGYDPANKGGSSPEATSARRDQEDLFNATDTFEVKREKVAQNFRDKGALIHVNALGIYARMLEEDHNSNGRSIRILDPAIIQKMDDFGSHQKILDAINCFNLEPNLNTIYIPIHIGSYPGYRNGHWICAALTRQLDKNRSPVAIVYNSLGSGQFDKNLAQFLGKSVRAKHTETSQVKHQYNAIDCGVHVLHFIDSMAFSKFQWLNEYLTNRSYQVDIKDARNQYAKIFETNAEKRLFQTENARPDLWTVKDDHRSKPIDKFIGVDQLKKIQSAQLTEFAKINDAAIRSEHFDWWTFPITRKSRAYGKLYALDNDSVKKLREDDDFMRDYRESAKRVLAAYGWDLKKQGNNKYVIEPIDDYDSDDKIREIRLAKIAESFYLFDSNLYDALVQLSKNYPDVGNLIQHSRTKAAFNLANGLFGSWF